MIMEAKRGAPALPLFARRATGAGRRMAVSRSGVRALLARMSGGSAAGPVVLVSDGLPHADAHVLLNAAMAALRHQDLVLGPTGEGGCWLVGLARRRRRLPPGALAAALRPGNDAIAAILARVPMRLWRIELLALEDFPRLNLSRQPQAVANVLADAASARRDCRDDGDCRAGA